MQRYLPERQMYCPRVVQYLIYIINPLIYHDAWELFHVPLYILTSPRRQELSLVDAMLQFCFAANAYKVLPPSHGTSNKIASENQQSKKKHLKSSVQYNSDFTQYCSVGHFSDTSNAVLFVCHCPNKKKCFSIVLPHRFYLILVIYLAHKDKCLSFALNKQFLSQFLHLVTKTALAESNGR